MRDVCTAQARRTGPTLEVQSASANSRSPRLWSCHIRATSDGQPRSTEATCDPTSTHFDVNDPAPSYDSQAEYAGSMPVIGSTL
jgi:hypothetical protein